MNGDDTGMSGSGIRILLSRAHDETRNRCLPAPAGNAVIVATFESVPATPFPDIFAVMFVMATRRRPVLPEDAPACLSLQAPVVSSQSRVLPGEVAADPWRTGAGIGGDRGRCRYR